MNTVSGLQESYKYQQQDCNSIFCQCPQYKNIPASYAYVIWKVEFSFGSVAIFCCIKIVIHVSSFEIHHKTLGWVYKMKQPHVRKCTHIKNLFNRTNLMFYRNLNHCFQYFNFLILKRRCKCHSWCNVTVETIPEYHTGMQNLKLFCCCLCCVL